MATPYETLGITLDADDAAVRGAYLELTRQFPPEQHPEKAAAVRAAYDSVKDAHTRARYQLLEVAAGDSLDALIDEVERDTPRRRPGLSTLLIVTEPPAAPARTPPRKGKAK